MAKTHTCQGCDHIGKVALQLGFRNWRTLWDADENARLRQARSNPNMLYKGDRSSNPRPDTLTIPEPQEGEEGRAADADHRFVVPVGRLYLRLRILKPDLTPISDAQYRLTVRTADGWEESTNGTTAGGLIEEQIPLTAVSGELAVRVKAEDTDPGGEGVAPPVPGPLLVGAPPVRGDVPVVWKLQIGALNPIMEKAPTKWCISGVQQRLNNLGFDSGPVDGIKGPLTTAGVKAFQRAFGLWADGKPGQRSTQPRLKAVHDGPNPIPLPPGAGAGRGGVPRPPPPP